MSTVVRPNYGTKGQDNITDLEELEGLLSPFQVEKLTYFFNQFFDFNEDGKIDVSVPPLLPSNLWLILKFSRQQILPV